MILYHMSDTVKVGDSLVPDHKGNRFLAEPFVKALHTGTGQFLTLLLNAEYFGAVLAKYGLSGMPTHEIKWATEGIFEFVRRKEFPEQCGRLQSNYFYPDRKLCRELYEEDWGGASEEERAKIKLFEVEVEGRLTSYDMRLFDAAFDHLYDHSAAEDVEHCKELARKYFRGEKGDTPVMEILGDGKAVAVRELEIEFAPKQ
ncbi:MAG: hypothetical protein IJU66_01070 [Oscillospiraceae bacterium]|nr:hypothetical protein [Oscillospiraceae bacterium]